MKFEKICSILESYLFLTSTLVSVEELKENFRNIDCILSGEDIKEALNNLKNKYELEESGLELIHINEKFQLVSKKTNNAILSDMISINKKKTLTSSAMETLTIIAYNQPVTKLFIENIKGTKSDATINTLLEYGLIEVKGQLKKIGNPNLYVTTDKFLKHLGISSLEQLPDYKYFNDNQSSK